MNIYAISDLHLSINNPKPMNIFGQVWDNYLDDIENSLQCACDDDIILLAGDLSWAMALDDAAPDLAYIGKYPGHKVIIRGNHDYWWKSISAVRAALPAKVYAVQNDCVKIGDVVIGGSRGWSLDDRTEEGKKIFARELIRIELSLQAMQKIRGESDRAVFMIHYPPFNARLEASSVTALFEKYGVSAVIYGHLHGKDCRSTPLIQKSGINYYLTSCDQVQNRAVKIEI